MIVTIAIALQFVAQTISCSAIRLVNAVPGRLIIVVSDRGQRPEYRACIAEGNDVKELLVPADEALSGARAFHGASWGPAADQVLLTVCDSSGSKPGYCPIALTTLSGRLIRKYPSGSATTISEADGRTSPLIFGGPRVSPAGDLVAAHLGETLQIIRVVDGETIASIRSASTDYAWSPDGSAIAYTRSPTLQRSPAQESQLFVHDLHTATDRQLTRFEPQDYRPWWKSFVAPLLRYPVVSGVTWARQANVIGFYVAPDRDLHVWRPNGYEVRRVPLEGKCFRDTHLDTVGGRAMYLAGTSSERCLGHAWDEIRLADFESGSEHVVVEVRDKKLGIERIDWATD